MQIYIHMCMHVHAHTHACAHAHTLLWCWYYIVCVCFLQLVHQESYQYNLLLMFVCKGIYHISIKCAQQAVHEHDFQLSRNFRNLTGSSRNISGKNPLLDLGRQDARTNQLVSVSPILPSSLKSHSPLPSLHSPTPVYELHSPPLSPQGYTLQDTLVGPLTTLEIY